MQDNYNNNFEADDQFYDQAWSNMKGMLDQEMPVSGTATANKGGQKKYALLLLLLLLGFGAGVGSVLLWQQKAIPATPKEQSPKYPIAKQQQNGSELHKAGSEQIETPTTFVESNSKTLEKPTLSTPLAEKDKPLVESKRKSTSNFSTNFNTPKNTTSEKTSTLLLATTNTSSNPTTSDNNLSDSRSQSSLSSKALLLASKELTVFEKSDLLPLSLNRAQFVLENKEEKEKVINKLIIPALKKVQFNWGLALGWHSEPTKGYGGYTIGFIVDAEVDRKFGIESGLSYSRFQFNDILLNDSPDAFDLNKEEDSGVYADVTGVPFTPRSDQGGASPVRLGSASYLSIPVLMTYKATRTLRVNMGVEYARMLSANSNKFNDSSSEKTHMTSYSLLNPSVYGDLLNKTNFSAIFGLSVQPNEQFGFDLRYNHGFTDLSINKGQFATQNDTRESLQFSLLYYFGKRK